MMIRHVLVSSHHEVVVLVMLFRLGALLWRHLLTFACARVCRSLNQSDKKANAIEHENQDAYAVEIHDVAPSVPGFPMPYLIDDDTHKANVNKLYSRTAAERRYVLSYRSTPNSGAPSAADINSLRKNGASFGVIACHDGSIMKFEQVGEPIGGYNALTADRVSRLMKAYSGDESGLFSSYESVLG